MSRTVAFVGCHASGKTTIGRRVANILGWRFDPEIGERLATGAAIRDPRMQPASFDEQIFALEFERDRAASAPRVVETWHPGNLAYAFFRNPDTYFGLRAAAKQAFANMHAAVAVQPLTLDYNRYAARFDLPGPEQDRSALMPWMFSVGKKAAEVAVELQMRVLQPVDTSDVSIDAATAACMANISAWNAGQMQQFS